MGVSDGGARVMVRVSSRCVEVGVLVARVVLCRKADHGVVATRSAAVVFDVEDVVLISVWFCQT